jgi:septum formation protein
MSDEFPSILLASSSPRRREILAQLGVQFSVYEHAVDEVHLPEEPPETYVQRLALEKALSVQAQQNAQPIPILGSDTIVVCGGQILGKPKNEKDARRMLRLLSGQQHQVYSAVAICCGDRHETVLVRTDVTFKTLSEQEIAAYWQSEEPLGKAGAYAIQGLGGMFVTSISGSYSAVVGLPIYETSQLLARFGVSTGLYKDGSP